MRRILAAGIAAIALAGLLTACNGQNACAAEPAIVIVPHPVPVEPHIVEDPPVVRPPVVVPYVPHPASTCKASGGTK